MPFINSIISWFITKRMVQIELFKKYPVEVQRETLDKLLHKGKRTLFGKEHGFSSVSNYAQFKSRVPVRDYTDLKPYIQRALAGESNVMWPGEVKWFAKSSGTTSDKSKFIPVTHDNMEACHFRGGKDISSIYLTNYPDSGVFLGKILIVGGSHQISEFNTDSFFGDLSAVLLQNLPFWAQMIRTPELSIALMPEWESKIEKLAEVTSKVNVTNISGVPSWTLVLLKRILERSGKSSISEIWPNLEVYVHGGVRFDPYREQFKQLFQNERMRYLETYNASEGFFGIQDDPNQQDLLLMLDYEVFFEFIPLEHIDSSDDYALPIWEVETGKNYAMVISTSSGLWRYLLGDTIRFTSLQPVKFVITGRTKHFINALGEELIIDNADQALYKACQLTHAEIAEYTAAPVYMNDTEGARHQWLIEFVTPPENLDFFADVLDNNLKALNSDYEAKRYKNMTLHAPEIISVQQGVFYHWLKSKGKLGGQHKVPRLSNDRKIAEEILQLNPSL
ncbi:MAG: GH3 auxin-responsive promoter family protein [Bacteroidales bacterium]|nr:GH3 auxin-responsive promoter family protein [Bacteroidales bacterium]